MTRTDWWNCCWFLKQMISWVLNWRWNRHVMFSIILEGYSLTTSPICLDPLFSNSARTLVSNASDATRKKNSFTFSPTAWKTWTSIKNCLKTDGWQGKLFFGEKNCNHPPFRKIKIQHTHLSVMTQPSTLLWSLVPASGHPVRSEHTEQETVGETRITCNVARINTRGIFIVHQITTVSLPDFRFVSWLLGKFGVHYRAHIYTQICTLTSHTSKDITKSPILHLFGLWEQAGEPRGKPRRHWENMQTTPPRPGNQTQDFTTTVVQLFHTFAVELHKSCKQT